MNCTKAEQLIPLDAGGDLQPPETDSLRQHIETCAHCLQVAEEFAASQVWLTEFAAPSFDESVFADLRASVRREIEHKELAESAGERGRWFGWLWPNWNPQFAFVATALLLLGVVWMIYRSQQPSKQVTVAGGPTKPGLVKTASPMPEPIQKQLVAADPQLPKSTPRLGQRITNRQNLAVATPLSRKNGTENPVETASTSNTNLAVVQANPEREMLRIEMQTSDPNIRIIWFAPKPDNSPTDKTK